jgi:hypothetical protein
MAFNTVMPGPAVVTLDNTQVSPKSDQYGNTTIQEFGGRYAELIRRSCMFMYNLPAAGQALLLSATTGLVPTIWNPLNSGKIFYVAAVGISWLSGATVAGSLNFCFTLNTGSAMFATAPIKTFVQVANQPINALVGSTYTSSMLFSPTTNTFVAAPANNVSFGANINATNGGGYVGFWDVGGLVALAPGNAVSLTYSVTTSTALLNGTIWGYELPIPANY